MIRMFGSLFLTGGVLSVLTGVTYWRGLIRRDERPQSFWINTIGLFVLGGGSLIGLVVCR